MRSSLNLVVVVVQANDVGVGEAADLTSWSSNTTSDIENEGVWLDSDLGSKEMLVSGNGLVETLSWVETAEMETVKDLLSVTVETTRVLQRAEAETYDCPHPFSYKSVARL